MECNGSQWNRLEHKEQIVMERNGLCAVVVWETWVHQLWGIVGLHSCHWDAYRGTNKQGPAKTILCREGISCLYTLQLLRTKVMKQKLQMETDIQFWVNMCIFCRTVHPRELVSTIGMHVARPTKAFLAKAATKKCILKSLNFCGTSTWRPRTG